MSVYLVKGKGWRFDFILKGTRYTGAWFKTKREARLAELKRREEIEAEEMVQRELAQRRITQTDMDFLELVNRRLDYIKAYRSERHYRDTIYYAKRWIKEWKGLKCSEITTDMIQSYLIRRFNETSGYTANKDLRYLRALFNFGIKSQRGWIKENPTEGLEFFPVEKKLHYIPPKQDILRVILAADPDTQDYLWTIALTLGRIGEINRLTWQDVDLEDRSLILYTRKKRGGHLTPRRVPMCEKLYQILKRRYMQRDKRKPWVFWHRYWDRNISQWVEGPYKYRKRLLRGLCKRAGVKPFGFHALRHFGASVLDKNNIPIGVIQRILGHENRTTTEIYLHSICEAEREAVEVLNQEISENSHTSPTQIHTQAKNRFNGEL